MICTWEDSAALGLGCHSQMLIPTRPLLWLFYSLRKYTGFNLQRKGPQSFEARGLGRVNTRFNHQQKSLYKSLKQESRVIKLGRNVRKFMPGTLSSLICHADAASTRQKENSRFPQRNKVISAWRKLRAQVQGIQLN
uniref:Uncharacterized protein n=1 Tax=Physcomitrium patens TaxID=3218 RepID=A0A2K1KPD3_PHYPA|nr:hypothetical protein PHYPA_006540 [Physcomitrium patens]